MHRLREVVELGASDAPSGPEILVGAGKGPPVPHMNTEYST